MDLTSFQTSCIASLVNPNVLMSTGTHLKLNVDPLGKSSWVWSVAALVSPHYFFSALEEIKFKWYFPTSVEVLLLQHQTLTSQSVLAEPPKVQLWLCQFLRVGWSFTMTDIFFARTTFLTFFVFSPSLSQFLTHTIIHLILADIFFAKATLCILAVLQSFVPDLQKFLLIQVCELLLQVVRPI